MIETQFYQSIQNQKNGIFESEVKEEFFRRSLVNLLNDTFYDIRTIQNDI